MHLSDKLTALRRLMVEHQVEAYFIPSADEHMNEYLPTDKIRREWMSGFSGSAGDLLVGLEKAWIFVDSRYHEQVDQQVDTELIQAVKLGKKDEPTLMEVLETLAKNQTIAHLGLDPFTVSEARYRQFEEKLSRYGITLISPPENLVDQVWHQSEVLQPSAVSTLVSLPLTQTGQGVPEKLLQMRNAMTKAGANLLPITKLDQIAWLFNLRGSDIPYNPVFMSYAILTPENAYLCTALNRVPTEIQQHLTEANVTCVHYDAYAETLLECTKQFASVLLDKNHTTHGTVALLSSKPSVTWVETDHPIEKAKGVKNAIEVEQMRFANLNASRAIHHTLSWVKSKFNATEKISEADVAQKIETNYSLEAEFHGLSFNTIAGIGANSSIVHYGTPSADKFLRAGDFLLLDSGAHFGGGTTDCTRTLVAGKPTEKQIKCYTAALRAHIACAMQIFPVKTPGVLLDGICRSPLWNTQLDYGHGTGHGVGAYLNVHEGPHGIHQRANTPLEPGMVTSVEPGYYEPGWGGIRLENLYVVQPYTKPDGSIDSEWLCFESLIWVPFEENLIDQNQLTPAEKTWLDTYHTECKKRL